MALADSDIDQFFFIMGGNSGIPGAAGVESGISLF
jgi:hypothetical protein